MRSKGSAHIPGTVTAVVEILLAQDADVNLQDKRGMTALISASDHGHAEVVKVLLAKGADVNHQTKSGKTALSMADTKTIAQLLKAAGAK